MYAFCRLSAKFWAMVINKTVSVVKELRDTQISKIQYCYCSLTKSCPTHCDPMKCNMPGFPVLLHLPEFVQTHVHRVNDAIQP